MTKDEFITKRTQIISDMLDNPDKYGIYPTTKAFKEFDKLFDDLEKQVKELKEYESEWVQLTEYLRTRKVSKNLLND